MELTLIILACIIWYCIGFFGFIYFATLEFDFLVGDLIFAILLGIGGVLSFIMAWLVFSPEPKTTKRVLFQKRGNKKETELKDGEVK